jgi:hypothetical protein
MHGNRGHKSTGLDAQGNRAVVARLSPHGAVLVTLTRMHHPLSFLARLGNDNFTRYGLLNPKMI